MLASSEVGVFAAQLDKIVRTPKKVAEEIKEFPLTDQEIAKLGSLIDESGMCS